MNKTVELFNPATTAVRVAGPDGKIITVAAKSKIILPEFFTKYTPTKLRLVRFIDINENQTRRRVIRQHKAKPKPNYKKNVIPNKPVTESINRRIQKQRSMRGGSNRASTRSRGARVRHRIGRSGLATWRSSTVGRADNAKSQAKYVEVAAKSQVPVSNNVGVGILSFNRIDSLRRLITSIQRNTNLDKTTVFVSDESSDLSPTDLKWLQAQNVVVLHNPRIGVAGNSNRLLRCLDRFKYKFILNDDVEILAPGWEDFYVSAIQESGVHHFCYREVGVYGANEEQENVRNVKNVPIRTVMDKPQGAIMVFDQQAFEAVGYFDEKFPMYGMEHVDWSNRVARVFNMPGFHDVAGSENFFRIHNETSKVPNRIQDLRKAKEYYEQVKDARVRVDPLPRSDVPTMSVVIPYRNTGRSGSMRTVVNNIRAQRFPRLEIILVEQDANRTVNENILKPIKYFYVPNKLVNMPFCKAMAFNRGVLEASHNLLVLHDADIITPGSYLRQVYNTLQHHTGCHLGEHVYYLSDGSTKDINRTGTLSPDYSCVRLVKYFEGGSLGMHRKEYIKAGGFNEDFIGYGVEDCCFYKRLADLSKFANDRRVKFFHLFHTRTPGWDDWHDKNRSIYGRMLKQYPSSAQYAERLRTALLGKYPKFKG